MVLRVLRGHRGILDQLDQQEQPAILVPPDLRVHKASRVQLVRRASKDQRVHKGK